MKSFLITLLVAAALTAGSILYTARLESCADRLNDITAGIITNLSDEDYTAAMKGIDRLCAELYSLRPFIAAFGNHSDIDLIESNLAELEIYAKNRQKYDAEAKARVISVLFLHLPDNTHIRIENIL